MAERVPPTFVVGATYRRRALHEEFGGPWQSGVSPSSRLPIIFLFTGKSGRRHGYEDEEHDDGSFTLIGHGQHGDMELTRGNLAIAKHETDGKDLHLFEQVGRGMVRYRGQFVYERHAVRPGVDRDHAPRKILAFELLPIDSVLPQVQDIEAASSLSLDELRARALGRAQLEAPATERIITTRRRSVAVRAYVLKRSKGNCEACGARAPFLTASGEPYLEPHHVRRLSDGGPDHPRFVIAVCPNCHRRAHYAADATAFNDRLQQCSQEVEATVAHATTQ